MTSSYVSLPVLAIDEKVLFPRTYARLTITTRSALQLLKDVVWEAQSSINQNNAKGLTSTVTIAVFTTRDKVNKPATTPSFYEIGTMAKIVQLSRIHGSTGLSILVQGLSRIRFDSMTQTSPYPIAQVESLASPRPVDPLEIETRATLIKERLQAYLAMMPTHSRAILLRKTIEKLDTIPSTSIGVVADLVASAMDLDVDQKQQVLTLVHPLERCDLVLELLTQVMEKHKVQESIASTLQQQIERTRREFLLRQQLAIIKKELGEGRECSDQEMQEETEVEQLEQRLKALALEKRVDQVVKRELRRWKGMHPSQPEYSLVQNYLEFITELPWKEPSEEEEEEEEGLWHVENQLDQDHYGLEKVKKRILEYIAVRRLKPNVKGPILCLVGPPGVGKTSLGKSIAIATHRPFERIALGGVHDEAEIRGHRKTYIGAMPGCILNALRHAQTRNPVVVLDEVDKLGKDVRGDPAHALLEVLDPHQNHTFTDHYLNAPFDLSQVLFIATANSVETIPEALLDRMEVIQVEGYSVEQKVEIAKRYLLPRQVEENGLMMRNKTMEISIGVWKWLIMNYTREAGVRGLEQQIAALCRFVAVSIVKEETGCDNVVVVDQEMIQRVLGPPLVFNEIALRSTVPGVATGLAWSSVGGSILFVEASCSRSRAPASSSLPKLHLTGKLGDVMKESAQLALSWLVTHASCFEITATCTRVSFNGISDLHVHFPQGAIPKDGPSAGIAIVCAILSVLTQVIVPMDIAMTGEMTLRGLILPVGGIREKVLAAIRGGIQRVILPHGNAVELKQVQQELKNQEEKIQVVLVKDAYELIELVFGSKLKRQSMEDSVMEMEVRTSTVDHLSRL